MLKGAQIRRSFLSERLYHFFARNDESTGVAVFKSITENGFLLTVANQTGGADEFIFGTPNGPIVVHVEQLARVCFTDIPEDKLEAHSDEADYGMFALGFSRRTIVSWAGSPVWYLPNTGTSDLADAAGVLIQYLRFGRDALKVLQMLYQHPNCQPTLNFADGAALLPADVIHRSYLADGCIARALSFVKEMSPRNSPEKEFEYLYEREWRIVDGLKIREKDVCQRLSPPLRSALLKVRPEWGGPVKSKGDTFKSPYFSQPMIDHFRLFNGLDSINDTVAKAIVDILVPTAQAKREIEIYISANSDRFANPPPIVRIFGRRHGFCKFIPARWRKAQ
jgi:hypothetical protein